MKSVKLLLLSVVAAILTSCGTTSTVPITGRKQNLIVSDEQVLSLSTQQYQQYMAIAPLFLIKSIVASRCLQASA